MILLEKKLNKGDVLDINHTNSLIQGIPIKGNVIFDSWDIHNKRMFISIQNEPIGKRFLITAQHKEQ